MRHSAYSGASLTVRLQQTVGQVTAPKDCCQPRRQSVPRAPAVSRLPRRRLPAVEQLGSRIPAKPARLVRPHRAPAAICGATAQLAASCRPARRSPPQHSRPPPAAPAPPRSRRAPPAPPPSAAPLPPPPRRCPAPAPAAGC
eukprot:scaffold72433_cov60-Phaeocystis_antarctica.AAC.3